MTEIFILGTSHVSPQSLKKIRKHFREVSPNLVCIELDRNRYFALINEQKLSFSDSVKMFGFRSGIVAWLLGYIQRKLGEKTGIMPGKEMLVAAEEAKSNGVPLALIDRRAEITLKKLSAIPLWDKLKLFFSVSNIGKSLDIENIPTDEDVEKITNELRRISPRIYNILIKERDHYMATAIASLVKERKPERILVVVGAGHKSGLKEILIKTRANSVRLL